MSNYFDHLFVLASHRFPFRLKICAVKPSRQKKLEVLLPPYSLKLRSQLLLTGIGVLSPCNSLNLSALSACNLTDRQTVSRIQAAHSFSS